MALVTAPVLAVELALSESKVRRMTRAGEIPCSRAGRAVRYEVDRVKDALRLASQPMAPPVVSETARPGRRQLTGELPRWFLDMQAQARAEAKAARAAARRRA